MWICIIWFTLAIGENTTTAWLIGILLLQRMYQSCDYLMSQYKKYKLSSFYFLSVDPRYQVGATSFHFSWPHIWCCSIFIVASPSHNDLQIKVTFKGFKIHPTICRKKTHHLVTSLGAWAKGTLLTRCWFGQEELVLKCLLSHQLTLVTLDNIVTFCQFKIALVSNAFRGLKSLHKMKKVHRYIFRISMHHYIKAN